MVTEQRLTRQARLAVLYVIKTYEHDRQRLYMLDNLKMLQLRVQMAVVYDNKAVEPGSDAVGLMEHLYHMQSLLPNFRAFSSR